MESTVKQLNGRIKGTERLWNNTGGESMLQIKADTRNGSNLLTDFWTRCPTQRPGLYPAVTAAPPWPLKKLNPVLHSRECGKFSKASLILIPQAK